MKTLYIITLLDGRSYSDPESELKVQFDEYRSILKDFPSMDFIIDLSQVKSFPQGIVRVIKDFSEDYLRKKGAPLPIVIDTYWQKNTPIYGELGNQKRENLSYFCCDPDTALLKMHKQVL